MGIFLKDVEYLLKPFPLFLIFLSLLSFSVLGDVPSSVPGTWKGYVYANTTLAENGLPVSAFITGTMKANTSTYTAESRGFYILEVEGLAGQSVGFQVCGVNAYQENQSWSSGPHYNGTSTRFNLTWNRSADSATCTYACGCIGGYCNSGVCASSPPSTGGTTPSGGGGGGGAATTTTTATTTTATTTTTTTTIIEQKTVAAITPAAPATITMTQPNLAIEQISVEVKNAVSNVQITVTQTSAAPTAAASSPVVISSSVGSIYKYIEISKANVQDSDIAKTKIKFKVEKSWIDLEGINSATIAMSKLVNNAWSKLPTTKLSEDSNYIYFESELSSLSVFAVTGEKIITTTTVRPTTTTIPSTTTTLPQPKMKLEVWFVLAIAVVLIAAVVIHFFGHKKSIWPW